MKDLIKAYLIVLTVFAVLFGICKIAWGAPTSTIVNNLFITKLSGNGTVCLQVTNAGLVATSSAACSSGGGGGSGSFSVSSTPQGVVFIDLPANHGTSSLNFTIVTSTGAVANNFFNVIGTVSSTEIRSPSSTIGIFTVSGLAGSGQLCVHVDNNGLLGTAVGDCGSASGGTINGTDGQLLIKELGNNATSVLQILFSSSTGLFTVNTSSSFKNVSSSGNIDVANGGYIKINSVPVLTTSTWIVNASGSNVFTNNWGGSSTIWVYSNPSTTIPTVVGFTDAATTTASNTFTISTTTSKFTITIPSNVAFFTNDANYVVNTRAINTSAPLSGGGNLSADRTIACASCLTGLNVADGQALFGLLGGGATSSVLVTLSTSTGIFSVGSSSLTNVSSSQITGLVYGSFKNLYDLQGNKFSTSTGGGFTNGVDSQVLFGMLGGNGTSSALFTISTSTGVFTSGSSSLANVSGTRIDLTGNISFNIESSTRIFTNDINASNTLNVGSSTTGLLVNGGGQVSIATNTQPANSLFHVGTSTTIFNIGNSGKIGIGTSSSQLAGNLVVANPNNSNYFMSVDASAVDKTYLFNVRTSSTAPLFQVASSGKVFVSTGNPNPTSIASSTPLASLGGTIYYNNASTGNGAGASTTIMTYQVPTSTFANSGDEIDFWASGNIANNADSNKEIQVVASGTIIFDSTRGTSIIPANVAGTWFLESRCSYIFASSTICASQFTDSINSALTDDSGDAGNVYSNLVATTSWPITIYGNGSTAGSVSANYFRVQYWHAP